MLEDLIEKIPSQWGRDCYRELLSGDWKEGFRNFEKRHRSRLPAPQWTGQQLHGQTVLLTADEGGYGDMHQFVRYAPLVSQRGGKVILLVPRNLSRLYAKVPGVERIIPADLADGSAKQARTPGIPVALHYYCPFMSLSYAFGTTIDNVPNAVPYLQGDPTSWAEFLAKMPGLKVGLCWAGEFRPTQPIDRDADKRRSMKLAQMSQLLDVQDCSFVSLQLGPPASQIRLLRGDTVLRDVFRRLKDWKDTADLIAGLDLVISVDTAVCHLAGALGRPVWMLNRFDTCWRWLLDRTDTPWYPTMRIFRQPAPGDWESVVGAVAGELRKLAAH